MDLDVAAAQRASLGWPGRNGDGKSVCSAGLAVIGHVHREGTRHTIVRACAIEGGSVARDNESSEHHAVHLGPTGMVDVLQLAAYGSRHRLRLHDEPEGPDTAGNV